MRFAAVGRNARTWLICNQASGSNDAAAVADLCDRLDPERVFSCPEDDLPDAAELAAGGVGVLAIFTGDGTANAALARAEGFPGRVLMLPGGTTNLLSGSLHGDEASLDTILAAFEAGELGDTGRMLIQTSCGFAHSEVLAGPGAAWSDVRETLRDLDVGAMVETAGEALQQTADGPAVLVADPAVGSMEGYPAVLLSVVGDEMRVDGYFAEGLGDYFRQGVALLMRDFRSGPHDELGRHGEVVLRSEGPIELMIDGERCAGATEERLALRRADLTFLSLLARSRG